MAVSVSSALVLALTASPHLPESSLSVRVGGEWKRWWSSTAAPSEWRSASPVLASALRWRRAGEGVEWSEVQLAGSGEAWRTRLVVARVDPSRVRLVLDTAFASDARAAWTIDRAPANALLAVNAGQFGAVMPWGWVVLDGRQFLSAGRGPLVSTIAIDSSGNLRWRHGDLTRGDPLRPRWAFQTYPTLLDNGTVPGALQGAGLGLDVSHRDARVAIGGTTDGKLLIAMTRFDALGQSLGFVPFGLTTPEMAAVMGALGATDAALLDGGISSQLLIREASGATRRFSGMRSVPLALIALPRFEPHALMHFHFRTGNNARSLSSRR